jgi:hypothetical protein
MGAGGAAVKLQRTTRNLTEFVCVAIQPYSGAGTAQCRRECPVWTLIGPRPERRLLAGSVNRKPRQVADCRYQDRT